MMIPQKEIDQALTANVAALVESWFDLLAALLAVLIGLVSLLHAFSRLVFASLGLLVWAFGLLVVVLYGLQSWAASKSPNSLHGRRGL